MSNIAYLGAKLEFLAAPEVYALFKCPRHAWKAWRASFLVHLALRVCITWPIMGQSKKIKCFCDVNYVSIKWAGASQTTVVGCANRSCLRGFFEPPSLYPA